MNENNDSMIIINKPTANIIDISNYLKNRFIDKELIKEYSASEIIMEYVGRICYNSYDAINDNSIKPFLSTAAKKNHRTIFEFCNLQFDIDLNNYFNNNFLKDSLQATYKFLKFTIKDSILSIKGSLRGLIEFLESYPNNDFPIYIYISLYQSLYDRYNYIINELPTYQILNHLFLSYTHKRELINKFSLLDITSMYQGDNDFKILTKIECDRSQSHEIVRHRIMSVLQESQRYVRFNKDNPYKICLGSKLINDSEFNKDELINILIPLINYYSQLLKSNKPEDARIILPNCTQTTLFIYADKPEYKHIFNLRQSKYAYHPVKEIFDSIYYQFINDGLFN